jgi:DNA-binding XRE family transcriptional regulator
MLKDREVTPEDFRQARERAGLTQPQAAEVLGVSVWSIRNWEQALRAIPSAFYELLLLKTGQFRLRSYKPGVLRLKLAGGPSFEISIEREALLQLIEDMRSQL